MGSEARLKTRIAGAIIVLSVLSVAAGTLLASPRMVVVCVLGMLACVLLIRSSLAQLAPQAVREEVLPGTTLMPEQQAILNNALMLEARLEHTPIALFGTQSQDPALLLPLNANARRLIAPGRASNPADLFHQLAAQPAGVRSVIGFDTERGVERALVAVSSITLYGESQRLIALMPVESELEMEALNSWQRLVHVLTHEIMNSLTPVASMTRTAYDLLAELKPDLPADAAADFGIALDAISRRAASLVDFVASYRSLSNLPESRPELIEISHLFERISMMVKTEWQSRGGRAEFSVEPASLRLMADPGQLEQAIINLLKNAAEATQAVAAPEVEVSARLSRGGRLRINVTDNGPGVPDKLIADIFTPFFTTKKHGGGIGLAMVRHLVHANGGTVRYSKSVSTGARFVITF
jgi:signal transduction histidine kinase